MESLSSTSSLSQPPKTHHLFSVLLLILLIRFSTRFSIALGCNPCPAIRLCPVTRTDQSTDTTLLVTLRRSSVLTMQQRTASLTLPITPPTCMVDSYRPVRDLQLVTRSSETLLEKQDQLAECRLPITSATEGLAVIILWSNDR